MEKSCVLATGDDDNYSVSSNSIIFIIKDTKWYVPVVTLSAKTIKIYKNIWKKDLKGHFVGMNIKLQNMSINIFSNLALSELPDCLFSFIQTMIWLGMSWIMNKSKIIIE